MPCGVFRCISVDFGVFRCISVDFGVFRCISVFTLTDYKCHTPSLFYFIFLNILRIAP